MRSMNTATNCPKCCQIAKLSSLLYKVYAEDKDDIIRFHAGSKIPTFQRIRNEEMVKTKCISDSQSIKYAFFLGSNDGVLMLHDKLVK